jgi:hypothetical protein
LAGGGKRSIFTEEALHESEQLCRNCLLFLQKNQKHQLSSSTPLDSTVILNIFKRSSEYYFSLLSEQQSFKVKVGDLNQVPLDEINDVARSHNEEKFAGLSLQQRHAIYLKKISEVIVYMDQKIGVFLSKKLRI